MKKNEMNARMITASYVGSISMNASTTMMITTIDWIRR
jgi:hypothetical protein